jgi:hypothetical protein
MPPRAPRVDVLRRLSEAATRLLASAAAPRPGPQPLRERGDATTLLGPRLLDGAPPDAARELARGLVDLPCVAEGIAALAPGAPTDVA